MARFAQVDSNGLVLRVVIVDNNNITDKFGEEQEALGILYLHSLAAPDFTPEMEWVQTSFSGKFRKQCACEGYTFNKIQNIFIAPKPYEIAVLNPVTFDWQPPFLPPDDGEHYEWNAMISNYIKMI